MKPDKTQTRSKRRTKAKVLALVNWRGVFFMQYALDRHVTALEGANGAGKTTVMIAAYVVLLPDMSRLRFCFSNLTAESALSPYNPGTEPWRSSRPAITESSISKRRAWRR